MKNLHYLKKFVVMVLAAMMTLSTFALPTFAAGETDMTINGVEKNATVTGYQVVYQDVKTTQNPNGDNKWKMRDNFGENGTGNNASKWYVKGHKDEAEYEYKLEDKNWAPTAKILAALAELTSTTADANKITFNDTSAANAKEGVYVNNANTKGSWLVIATPGAPGNIYNPMLVSRDYATGRGVTASEANAKKSTIPFEKVVERTNPSGTNEPNDSVTGDGLAPNDNASAKDGNFDGEVDGNKGDTAGSSGGKVELDKNGIAKYSVTDATEFDNVAFRINTKIPAYADNYFKAEDGKYPEKTTDNFYNPIFKVDDELSKGLTLNEGITVKVGNTENIAATETLDKATDTYKVEYNQGTKDFVITFAPAFIKDHKGQNVEICYSAALNANHGVNFDQETNTAKIYYSNKPGENTTVDETRETYHYTFTINGKLEGDKYTGNENREIIKIGLENGQRVMKETVTTTTEKSAGWKPLQGVEFNLYKANAAGTAPDESKVIKSVITDKDGILRGMDQIDAGVYYLVETSVGPNTEYAKDTNPIKIAIEPTLDSEGRMTAYTVTVNDDIVVGNYKKVWTGNNPVAAPVIDAQKEQNRVNVTTENVNYRYEDNDEEAADIVNTKMGTLPSTGGMGTVLFTIGGVAIMAIALFLLFGGKKKQHQK